MASFTATPAHASFALKQAQAKKQMVDRVCQIVRKQLALPEDTTVTGETKFTYLGADSLDTVEILMSIEEESGISVDEDTAQSLSSVREVADIIEELLKKKSA